MPNRAALTGHLIYVDLCPSGLNGKRLQVPADAQAPSPYLNKPIKHLFSEVLVLEESNSLKAPNCDPNASGVGTLPSSSGHEYLELRCEKEFQIVGQQIVGQKRRPPPLRVSPGVS